MVSSSQSPRIGASPNSGLAVIAIAGVMAVTVLLFPFDARLEFRSCYVACMALLFIGLLSCYDISTRETVPLDPFYIVSVIYLFMYAICPMYDIKIGKYLWYGYAVFQNGCFATLVALIGYVAFYLTYRNSFKKNQRNAVSVSWPGRGGLPKYLVPFILLMWVFCFAANAFYMVSGGNSLVYCLTLGFVGEGGGESSDVSLGFVSMFSYALPATTLLYCQYGKGKLIKGLMIYLMIVLQVSRGFRFIIIQIVIMLLIYYRLKHKRYPNIALMGLVAFLMLAALLLMTIFRGDVRSGAGMDLSVVSSGVLTDAFDDMFWDNLRIYKNYFGMVGVIPNLFPFCYGDEIVIGTLVMLIPRIIWPSKPSMYGGEGLAVLIGPNIASGQAYPGLGEYYYALGVAGVVIMMSLFALLMKYISAKKGHSEDPLDWITYAAVASCSLQLIIRGYMPSNFWLVVFSVLPVTLVRMFFGSVSERRDLKQ